MRGKGVSLSIEMLLLIAIVIVVSIIGGHLMTLYVQKSVSNPSKQLSLSYAKLTLLAGNVKDNNKIVNIYSLEVGILNPYEHNVTVTLNLIAKAKRESDTIIIWSTTMNVTPSFNRYYLDVKIPVNVLREVEPEDTWIVILIFNDTPVSSVKVQFVEV